MAGSHHLILGGQRSGKSRFAERLASAWLETPGQSATLVATALAGDTEMAARISVHQADRAARVPRMATIEESRALAQVLRQHKAPGHLLVVDCLTLWLTNLLMPLHGEPLGADSIQAARDDLCATLRHIESPVVLVSNEIGLGLSPMSSQARHFVDELGWLHQSVAAECANVTLMVAGIAMPIQRQASS
ncbi:MAG: hypothetical protein RLZZ618_1885 [Pseudomonadota bacterium]|jgi:adenosylcobinamide kinase/adenosylcobinamide-phosphate guanylyltransferase